MTEAAILGHQIVESYPKLETQDLGQASSKCQDNHI